MEHSTRITKTSKVLDHLQNNGSITSWEAINLYGATRLSSIIYQLRKKYIIKGVDEVCTDRYGNISTFTRYVYCGSY